MSTDKYYTIRFCAVAATAAIVFSSAFIAIGMAASCG